MSSTFGHNGKLRRRALSLGSKFIIVMVVILAAILGTMSFYFIEQTRQNLFTHLEEESSTVGHFIALLSPEAILAFDFEALNAYVREASHGEDTVYAAVLDLNGTPMAYYFSDQLPQVSEAKALVTDGATLPILNHLLQLDTISHATVPVQYNNEQIASVVLGQSKLRVSSLARDASIQHLFINVSTILLLSFSIFFLFRYTALRPIKSLMQGAQRVAEGELTQPVAVYSNDELGSLTSIFNNMMQHLQQTLHEKDLAATQLQELNRTLEQRVTERTVELEQSETRMRAIIESMGEGIITIDERGYIHSMNPAAERIFRINIAQAQGVHSGLLLADSRTDNIIQSDQYMDEINSPFQLTHGHDPVEFEGRRFDGESFPMEMLVTSMHLGDHHYRVVILRDITRRKTIERSLAETQQQLVDAAHKSGMAEIAIGVLHNMGNVLNSVMTSGAEIQRVLKATKLPGLLKANELLEANKSNIGEFISTDPKGKMLPEYYNRMAQALSEEMALLNREIIALNEKTQMMKDVIATQQAYARAETLSENLDVISILEDAIRVQITSLEKNSIAIERRFSNVPLCSVHKSKLLQVLTNLVKNAKEAMEGNVSMNRERKLTLEVIASDNDFITIQIRDNGCGIDPANIKKIFNHGFTTKSNGHGFGLHTSALAMTEMGGKLVASSDGPNCGATFTVIVRAAEHKPLNTKQERAA